MAITFSGISAKIEGHPTIDLPYPTPVSAGDLLLAGRVAWVAGAVTTDNLTGWTALGELRGGTGTATDAHSTRVRGDYRLAAGGETGTVTFSHGSDVSTNDGAIGVMARYSKGSGTWDTAAQTGDDNTHAADRNVTLSSAHTVAVGDWLVAIIAVDTNSVDSTDISAATFTGTATFGTVTARSSGGGSSIGRDGNIVVYDVEVTGAGTCTGFTFTTAGLQCGPVNIVRLRELPPTGTDATVNAVALALSLTFPAPTITGTSNAGVDVPALALVLGLPTPAITAENVVTGDPLTLTLGFPAPSVSAGSSVGATVTPPALALTITVPAPTVTAAGNITIPAVPLGLVATFPAPTVDGQRAVTTSVPPLDLALTFPSPAAYGISGELVAPASRTLTIRAESRTHVVAIESRTRTISAESRTTEA